MGKEEDVSIRGGSLAATASQYEKKTGAGSITKPFQHQRIVEEEDPSGEGAGLKGKAMGHIGDGKDGGWKVQVPGNSGKLPVKNNEESAMDEHKKKDEAFVLEHSINLQHDVEHQMELLSVKKSQLPPWKIAFLGTLSGFWMALSGTFAFSAAGGMEHTVVKMFPVLPKLTLAFLAPVAMHFIVIFGGEFYSGNCMFMSVGYFKGRLTLITLLYNWASCFFWNLVGCVWGVWMFAYMTDLFADEPQLSFIIHVAESKARMNPWIVFLRAIPANFLICLAIQMGISAREMFGKIIVLHIPLTVYTVAGFEHAIGNLVIFPLGVMYGADASIVGFIFNNLIPAAVGNAIGGVMIGYIETLLFSWDQGLGNTNQTHNHTDQHKLANYLNIQVPMATTYTKKKIESTRGEINSTLDRLQQARRRLEELQKQLPVQDLSEPLDNAPTAGTPAAKDAQAYRAALAAAAQRSVSTTGSRINSANASAHSSFVISDSTPGASFEQQIAHQLANAPQKSPADAGERAV